MSCTKVQVNIVNDNSAKNRIIIAEFWSVPQVIEIKMLLVPAKGWGMYYMTLQVRNYSRIYI